MKNRKRDSVLGKIAARVLLFFAARFLESIPIIGPIFKMASLIADVVSIQRPRRVRVAA